MPLDFLNVQQNKFVLLAFANYLILAKCTFIVFVCAEKFKIVQPKTRSHSKLGNRENLFQIATAESPKTTKSS